MRLALGIAAVVVELLVAGVVSWRSDATSIRATTNRRANDSKRPLARPIFEPASHIPLGAVPGDRAVSNRSPLPRKLAEIRSTPQAKAAIERRYGGSAQYLVGVDTQLEVLARLDECIGTKVGAGYLDLHLWSNPDPKNHIQQITPMIEKVRIDDPADEELIRNCVETRLSGMTEPTVDPKFDRESSVTKMWITFPIRDNVAYRFLTTGERLEPKYADEMPEAAEDKRLEALAKELAAEAAKTKEPATSGVTN